MTKWIVKRVDIVIEYVDATLVDVAARSEANKNRLHNEIAKEGQDGWEAWHMAGCYIEQQNKEYIAIWFKRPDEST